MIPNDRLKMTEGRKIPAPRAGEYDPFVRGRFPVGVRTTQALDSARNRLFPCEIWYPATAQYAGYDFASGTRDTFAVPPRDTLRIQIDRKSTRLNSSHLVISYAVFCLK